MNYTKGKWTARLAGDTLDYPYYVDTVERAIANIWGGSRDRGEAEANARLIAAAPEMYEALKQLQVFYETGSMDFQVTKQAVLSALAKAEGK